MGLVLLLLLLHVLTPKSVRNKQSTLNKQFTIDNRLVLSNQSIDIFFRPIRAQSCCPVPSHHISNSAGGCVDVRCFFLVMLSWVFVEVEVVEVVRFFWQQMISTNLNDLQVRFR